MHPRIRLTSFLSLILAVTLHGVWTTSVGEAGIGSAASPAGMPRYQDQLTTDRKPGFSSSPLSGIVLPEPRHVWSMPIEDDAKDVPKASTVKVGASGLTTLQVKLVPPQTLEIPSLSLEAPIVPVSLGPSGELALSADPGLVFWYQGSSNPGRPGRALLAGHLDSPTGQAGIFANLSRLASGAEVVVVLANGERLSFTVVAQRRISAAALPPDLLHPSPWPELVLITCAGKWLPGAGRYSENLLIEAVLRAASTPSQQE